MKYNKSFFVESVVPDLVEHVYQESQQKTLRGIIVHLDNARPHSSRKSETVLTATKVRRIPAQPTVRFDLGVTSPFLECSRNECREHHTGHQDELISA
jgi:hypothetical protein